MNWRELDIVKYISLNYLSKNVVRHGKGKILPYKNAIIDLAENSVVNIYDKDISVGVNKLKGSKAETYIRLRSGAVWDAKGGCEISCGSTIEVLADAEFDTEYFTMNSASTIVAKERIVLGSDVMIARNVVIYDSDFHAMECDGAETVMSQEVHIGNHVWIGANSTVLKGIHIEDNSVVAANTVVLKNIDSNTMVGNVNQLRVLNKNVEWKR